MTKEFRSNRLTSTDKLMLDIDKLSRTEKVMFEEQLRLYEKLDKAENVLDNSLLTNETKIEKALAIIRNMEK